jgi:hypothetical protein
LTGNDRNRSPERTDLDDILRLADWQPVLRLRSSPASQPTPTVCGVTPESRVVPGAAVHYTDGRNGVKDFDVWSFYAKRDDGPFDAHRTD